MTKDRMSLDRTAPTTLRPPIAQRSAAPDTATPDGFAALLGAVDQATRRPRRAPRPRRRGVPRAAPAQRRERGDRHERGRRAR